MSQVRFLVALWISLSSISTAAQEAGPPEDRASATSLDRLEKASGLATAGLQILNESRITLPTLGAQLDLYKVHDPKTGTSRRIAIDGQSGRAVDPDDLLRRERQARYDELGSLHPELHRQVQSGQLSTIPVIIGFVVDERPIDKTKLDPEQALSEVRQQARQIEAEVVERASGLFRESLAKAGLASQPDFTQSGPFVSTKLPVETIKALSKDPRVAFIGPDLETEIPDFPTIPESLPTTGTGIAHALGSRGAGVRVAVLERGTPSVNSACFNLVDTQTGGSASSHMTKSLAIIGNRYHAGACNGSWEGYAPDASVYLGNAGSYTSRYSWAKDRGVNVVTMSWHFGTEETSGSLHSRDVYFDYWTTRYPWPSVFTSAGNQAASNAFASGKGFNFFGVANVTNDGDGNRCNDSISTSSTWMNPTSPHSDREVPEIASPGSRHDLIGTSFGGTSAATPVTAAIAAVLMSKNGNLKTWPEATRAILLATATYQDADGADWRRLSDGKDGTGMTSAYYGWYTAARREVSATPQFRAHDYGKLTSARFDGGFFEKTWKAKTFTTNSRIRVAFTWNSKVLEILGIPLASVLDADLDLWVYDPDMHLVATSSTWDSNYEFVELSPSKVGDYTIKVRGFSVPDDLDSYFGVAWTTHYELCS